MRRPRFMGRGRHIPPPGMNLVPLVDLALNLVLILLVMAPSMYLVRLPVKLPESKTSDSNTKEWIRVTYTAEGKLSVDGDLVESLDALPEELQKAKKTLKQNSFILEIDKEVPYRMASKLLDRVRKAVPDSRIALGTVPVNVHAKNP